MARNKDPKTAARLLDIKIRREKALQLRLDGHSLRAIQEQTGINAADLCRFFSAYKSESITALREELFDIQQARLTELWQGAISEARKFVPVLDAKGKEVTYPERNNDGKLVLDEAGQPKMVVMRDSGVRLNAINTAARIVEKLISLYGFDSTKKFEIINPETPTEFVFRVIRAEDGRPVALPSPEALAKVQTTQQTTANPYADD